MKKSALMVAVVLAFCGWAMAQADQKKTVTSVIDGTVNNIEKDLVPAVEAMPEDKFNFAPTNGEFKGVRTFAQQVKHVAETNYAVAARILGEKPPVDAGGENGPDALKTKADIVQFLKDSFAYAHKAVATINEGNAVTPIKPGEGNSTRLGLGMLFAWHGFDHYGQMVEYLRMNGIVPPASRGN